MGEIIQFTNDDVNSGTQIPVNGVIDGARDANLQSVLIIGWDENNELYVASSHSGRDCIADIELAKVKIVHGELAMIEGYDE